MALRESFRAKQRLDGLARAIGGRLNLPVGQRRLDKDAMRKLLAMTSFEPVRERDLELYARPLEGELKEVVVMDNELPIYHTTIRDVGMRKTPLVKEMLSIRNIRKILDDKDVVVSKAKESLHRLYAQAFSSLDFSYSDAEIAEIVQEGARGLERNSLAQAEENLQVLLELLDFEALGHGVWEHPVTAYAMPQSPFGRTGKYRDLILFDREELTLHLVRGEFSPTLDSDVDRLVETVRRNAADAEGGEVFEFLGRRALRVDPERRGTAIRPLFRGEEKLLEEA